MSVLKLFPFSWYLLFELVSIEHCIADNFSPIKCSFKGKLPDRRSCRHFHECSSDDGLSLSRRETCPTKLYFESKVSKCIKPPTPCVANPRALSLKGMSCLKNDEIRPSLIDCGAFLVCKDRVYEEVVCPANSRFHRMLFKCVREDDVCMNLNNIEASLVFEEDNPYFGKCDDKDGSIPQTLPDPYECSKYIECQRDPTEIKLVIMTIAECESGLLFDGESGLCVEASRVECGQRFRDIMVYGPEKSGDNSTLLASKADVERMNGATGSETKGNANANAKKELLLEDGAISIDDNGMPLKTKTGRSLLTNPTIELANGDEAQKYLIETTFTSTPETPPVENSLLEPGSFPEFNVEKYAQNYLGTRHKRRLKTIVRKTEAEFFDEDGNFTTVAKDENFTNVRPKMKVTYVETETTYDGSDELKEKKAREGKTAEEVATIVRDKLKLAKGKQLKGDAIDVISSSSSSNSASTSTVRSTSTGTSAGTGGRTDSTVSKSSLNAGNKINSRRNMHLDKKHRKKHTFQAIQKYPNYQEYEAPLDTDYEFSVEPAY